MEDEDEDMRRTGVEHDEPIARSNKRDGSTGENSVGKPRTVIGSTKSKGRSSMECMLVRYLTQGSIVFLGREQSNANFSRQRAEQYQFLREQNRREEHLSMMERPLSTIIDVIL